jgi:hypothetical protein
MKNNMHLHVYCEKKYDGMFVNSCEFVQDICESKHERP